GAGRRRALGEVRNRAHAEVRRNRAIAVGGVSGVCTRHPRGWSIAATRRRLAGHLLDPARLAIRALIDGRVAPVRHAAGRTPHDAPDRIERRRARVPLAGALLIRTAAIPLERRVVTGVLAIVGALNNQSRDGVACSRELAVGARDAEARSV